MIKNTTHNENGFTLIEVIIALAVLSLGIIGMMVMQKSGIQGNATAHTITTASLSAGDRIERIFAMDYDDLVDKPPGNGTSGLNNVTVSTADGSDVSNPLYQVFWNVVEDAPMPLTKTVRVIVTRQERGATRTVSYNYIKASVVN